MLSTDLGACEWFVWDLRRSSLIDRGQLDQVIGEFLGKNPGAEPPSLAEYLVSHKYLTAFQAERLLQGKTQGFVLGPFTLMDALGSGSMGTVYKAQSKTDNKGYAVKVLPRRSMWNVRIARRKVRAFEQCRHAAVVPFVDVGTAGGMHFLAWPLIEGETLDKVIARDGPLPAGRVAQLGAHVAEGLEQAHQQELFHGLLKPSNLMIAPDGQVKILDFGIGCLLAETEGESLVDTMSTANSVNSGLDCASPESIMDPTNLTPLGDQYSLGCVLYYCLAGRYPFPDGTAVEKMMCHQHKRPDALGDLVSDAPEGLIKVIEKLMAKNPSDRFASAAEVAEALAPFADESVPKRPALGAPRPLAPSAKLPSSPSFGLPKRATATTPDPDASPVRANNPQAAAVNARLAGLRPQHRPSSSSHSGINLQPEAAQQPVPPSAPVPAGKTWDQRLGPIGIALIAIIAGAAAWLLSSFIGH